MSIATVIPAARLGESSGVTLRRQAPAASGAADTPSAWIVREALERLGPPVRRKVLESRLVHGAEAPLVVDEGCDVRVGHAPVASHERRALLRWLPPPRAELAALQEGLLAEAPLQALALLLRPPTIWTAADALAAARARPGEPTFEPTRFVALEADALDRVGERELRETRSACERLSALCDRCDLRAAAGTVAAGSEEAAIDDGACARVAARQLARYACSRSVLGLLEQAPPRRVERAQAVHAQGALRDEPVFVLQLL